LETYIFNFPMDPDRMIEVQDLLRKNEVFLTNGSNAEDPYVIMDYLSSHVKVTAHIDRNILSNVLAIAGGRRLPDEAGAKEVFQVSAACWAFLSSLEATFDPSISLHETGFNQSGEAALKEYESFRSALKVYPDLFAKIATGELTSINVELATEIEELPSGLTANNLESKIKHWKSSYVALLKVAHLLRGEGQPESKVLSLANWMVDESIFNAFAMILGILGFSNNPPKGVVSGLKTTNRDKLKKTLKNISWDLTHIRHWSNACSGAPGDEIVLFCSLDKGLKTLASSALRFTGEELRIGDIRDLFSTYWPKSGEGLANKILEIEARLNSPNRGKVAEERMRGFDLAIKQMESSLV